MNLRDKFFPKKPSTFRIHHEEPFADKMLSEKLNEMIPSSHEEPLVVVCIGTDRSTGDALGPLIGSKLKQKNTSFDVYGTLDQPVHAVNLQETMEQINQTYSKPFIIGIDACLGRLSSVGVVCLADGPVKPGAGVKKELPPVGDIHMTGIVNVSGFMEYFVLQNTRLNLVMKMADLIADGISLSSQKMRPANVEPNTKRSLRTSFSDDLLQLP
ncbi:spore protease YyaC [Pseudalkalibacillus caeni]|uniref:Spore protease YyaC n=1 Tax=Exobacillus caeni TaxID=2574798 RepID=A0A5R9EV89_9BACL|nr:spore protease YyaC [Pseudalkalibacillus caeni]TLS35142.1 spore protease YyaC [Pseudalkalibacillus caeni]